jgi:hypothetical protein
MSRFEVTQNETAIVFLNTKTNKAEKLPLLQPMPDDEAIHALTRENKARESGSRASVSLLATFLNHPRFDGYKGQTPIGDLLPKELKEAMREHEAECMKPIFCGMQEHKGAKPATVARQWDEYIGALRAGSSYAVAKGKVLAYFAHCGKLPVADNGLLLSVAAIDKLLAIAREDAQAPEQQGIAGKLVKLSAELENRTESTKLGSPATAIAALKSMLATYEGLLREDAEAAQRIHEVKTPGDVAQAAAVVVGKAQRVKAQKKDEPALM